MRSFLVVALALWVPACGLYQTVQRRTQEFSLLTRPAGARVWMQDGSIRRELGSGPVKVTGEYEVEVTRFNRWWWLTTALSAGTTGVGGWMASDIDSVGTFTLGIVVLCYGVLGLIYSLSNNIAAEMDDGKERVLPASLELRLENPGYASRQVRVELPSQRELVLVELEPAWYTRYGFKLEEDLKDPGAVPALIRALSDEDASVRVEAVRALVEIGVDNPHVEKGLRWAASDLDPSVRKAALVALRKLDTSRLALESLRPEQTPVSVPARVQDIVAVLDIHDSAGQLGTGTRRQLSRYLSAAVSRVSAFRVIPPDQLRQRLSAEKRKSFSSCYDDACRIELGKALAAHKVLATDLLRVGNRCVLTASLYELRTETVEKSALVETDCTDEALVDGVKDMTDQLGR
jgi:hypothetical protein